MNRIVSLFAVVLLVAGSAMAFEKVNSRELPDSTDFSGYGASFQRNMQHINDALGEAANLMGSTVDGDDLAVDHVDAATVTTTGLVTAATLTTTGLVTAEYLKFGNVVANTSGTDTLTAGESGTVFVATKSDGATTYTLPDPGATTIGVVYTFIQTANQNLVVVPTTADGNSLVADAVATSDNVSCQAASHKIGSGIQVIGISATQWAAFALNSECPLTVEAAD